MKRIMISCALLVIVATLQAQERPFSLGLKIGVPQFAALEFESITPFLNSRLAVQGGFGYIPFSDDEFFQNYKGSLTMAGAGLAFYFRENHNGRGLYLHLGVGYVKYHQSHTRPIGICAPGNIILIDEYITSASSDHYLVSKLGFRLGKTFYFRAEAGFTTLRLPMVNHQTRHYSYYDPVNGGNVSSTTVHYYKDDSKFTLPVMPVLQIGFGIAFCSCK